MRERTAKSCDVNHVRGGNELPVRQPETPNGRYWNWIRFDDMTEAEAIEENAVCEIRVSVVSVVSVISV